MEKRGSAPCVEKPRGENVKKGRRASALPDADAGCRVRVDARNDVVQFRRHRRPSVAALVMQNDQHLQSDVSVDEVVERITFLQSCGVGFKEFDSDEVRSLAEALSVMRFEELEKVVEKGETGTWFGVLVSGSLKVLLPNITITVQPGALVGEMACWSDSAIRMASLVGGEPGLIATMLKEELPRFVIECPEAGAKLMRMMAEGSLSKHMANLRRARSTKMVPVARWGPGGAHETSAFKAALDEKGFEKAEADLLCEHTKFTRLQEGQVVTEAGQPWPFVMFVLQGALTMEAFDVEVEAGSVLGGLEFFGERFFSESSKLVAAEGALLAGIPSDVVASFSATRGLEDAGRKARGGVTFRVVTLMSQFALSLASAASDMIISRHEARHGTNCGMQGQDRAPGLDPCRRRVSMKMIEKEKDDRETGKPQPQATARVETFYLQKLRKQADALKASEDEAAKASRKEEQAKHNLTHYRVLAEGTLRKLALKEEEAASLMEELRVKKGELTRARNKLQEQKTEAENWQNMCVKIGQLSGTASRAMEQTRTAVEAVELAGDFGGVGLDAARVERDVQIKDLMRRLERFFAVIPKAQDLSSEACSPEVWPTPL